MFILAKRLKEARLRAGISQEKLGRKAGLDEMSASTRMNRYERGKRIPNPAFVSQLGKVLDVPASFFYAVDDDEAELLLTFHRLDMHSKRKLVNLAASLLESDKPPLK